MADLNIEQGRTLQIDPATVLNIGDQSGTQTIQLTVDDGGGQTQVDAITGVSLNAGERKKLTGQSAADILEWDTTTASLNTTYTVRLKSNDDTDSLTAKVVVAEGVTVSITSTNSPVNEGNSLDVDYSATNEGATQETQTLFLSTDNTVRDSTQVTIGSGNTKTGTLSWNTSVGDAGTYTAEVNSEDDAATTSVTIDSATGSGVSLNWANTSDFTDTQNAVHTVSSYTFAAGDDPASHALMPSNGNLIWEDLTPANNVECGDYYNSKWFVGDAGGSVRSLNNTNGSQNWSKIVSGAIISIAAGADVYCGDVNNGTIYQLDASTGNQQNSWQVHGSNRVYGITVTGGVVYSAGGDGAVKSLDPGTGNINTVHTFHGTNVSGGVDTDGTYLYSGGFNGKVIKAKISNGSKSWEHTLHGSARLRDIHVNKGVYSGAGDGYLRSADKVTGAENWSEDVTNAFGVRGCYRYNDAVYVATDEPAIRRYDIIP